MSSPSSPARPDPSQPKSRRPAQSGSTGRGAPKTGTAIPPLSFPEALPVSAKREEIARAMAAHQVIIVCGETGSGKTTQLPKIALSLGRGLGAGGQGLIGHTQPRRLAASTVAKRIASELGSPLGVHVGYKIRFNDVMQPGASVKLMTDGILLAEAQADPLLRAYDTIIIDEAHERSLNIDFLMGYLLSLLPRRRDLKLVITSATIDAERFAQHFASSNGPAPVVNVSGRLYDVEQRYRPFGDDPKDERELEDAVCEAVAELWREGAGDILAFFPGEREIRESHDALARFLPTTIFKDAQVLPLYSRLSAAEQDRVFEPSNGRRIVLATNVAETSLTVPGVRYVIDSGLARIKRYRYRNKVEQLQVEPISQASANQRAGRCGRVAEGICIRLFSEKDFLERPRFTDPEILRSSLAGVILRMESLRLQSIEHFPFVDAPKPKAIADGYALLNELGAVQEGRQITPLGRELALLPLDPRIARMLLAAREHNALGEMLVIASALSVQDPRERPQDAQQAADTAHKRFADEKSEFVGLLKLWQHVREAFAAKQSHSKHSRQMKQQFLSPLRLREWQDVHQQLQSIVAEQGWRINQTPASYEQLHLALLSGLLGNIGLKDEEQPHYIGARGIKFLIHPSSTLAKKAGRLVVAAELVETTRLFARSIARIEPPWLERVGGHLLEKTLSEPSWDERGASVVAHERATLYGVPVYHGRRVQFGASAPEEARQIFVQEALVAGRWQTQWPFLAHNLKQIQKIEALEHRARRQDVLVDDALIAAFYDEHLPAGIYSGASFDVWYKTASRASEKLLFLSKEALMRHDAAGVTTDAFPKTLKVLGLDLGLEYLFSPGEPRDGVTVTVPIYALNQLPERRLEWLVPGMLKEKVAAALKSLPQKPRARLVPMPESIEAIAQALDFGEGSFWEALRLAVRERTGLEIRSSDLKPDMLGIHLQANIRVVDADGRQLAEGRNLARLKAEHASVARGAFAALVALKVQSAPPSAPAATAAVPAIAPKSSMPEQLPKVAVAALTEFPETPLAEMMELTRGKQTLFGYPALIDKTTHVELEVFDSEDEAQTAHRGGLERLLRMALKEQLKHADKSLPDFTRMALDFMSLGSAQELHSHIMSLAISRAFLADPLPKSRADFRLRSDAGRERLQLVVLEIARLASSILTDYAAAHRKVQSVKAHATLYADLDAQLQALLPKRFLLSTPYAQLQHFARYLKAIVARVEKFRTDPQRDAARQSELAPLQQRLRRAQSELRGAPDARLTEYRWLLEELRVSFFAQELRTPMPVSVKRLEKVWQQLDT